MAASMSANSTYEKPLERPESAWVMTLTETGENSSNSLESQSSSTFHERPPTKRTLLGSPKVPSALTFLEAAAGASSALRFLLGSSTFLTSSSESESESDESESEESA